MIDTTIVGMPPVARLPATEVGSPELRAAITQIGEHELTIAVLRDLLRDASEGRARALERVRQLEDELEQTRIDMELVLESRPVVMEME